MKKAKRTLFSLLLGIIFFPLLIPTAAAIDFSATNQNIKSKYQSARTQYLKEINWWKTTRQQFQNARTKFQNLKNPEARQNYEKNAEKFLEKTIDVLIKQLESLKTWVENRSNLSEDEKQKIIAEIDKDIAWLEQQKSEITDASIEEIRAKAREIKQYWRKHRVKVKKITAQTMTARLDWVIARFENVSQKISDKIEELKSAGVDTTELETLLEDFNKKVELAKEKYQAAKEDYENISSLEDANQLAAQVRQFTKEANQYLREAHAKLVEIIKEMKKINQNTSSAE